ncbi:hypothetical protein [Streptomyces sp. NPDC058266]|uniref:hypothetical protein n=1 Tax=Streptomyces sp. NPDC058266 TaxID=3346412 RepID=UPI0036E730C4
MTDDLSQITPGPQFIGARIVHADEQLAPPRRFVLRRRVDVSGISGTGDVADGVLWPDGTASIRWRGEHPSVVFWDRGRVSVETIHGHQGATEVVFVDQDDEQPVPAADGVPLDPVAAPLVLRRVLDHALRKPVPCPNCTRTSACRCIADRSEERVDAVLAALGPWLATRPGDAA